MTGQRLEFEVTSELLPGDSPGQPELGLLETGIRIGATHVAYAEGALAFRLLVSYALPSPLFRAYEDVESAMFVTLANPATGQTGTFNLEDAFSEPVPRQDPNYKGDPELPPQLTAVEGGRLGVEVAVRLEPEVPEAKLVVTVHLRDLASNTLVIDAPQRSVKSYEEGGAGAR